MHDHALTAFADGDRDRFRSAVGALPPGPLRDVLTAVAYARDAAARTGTGAAPHDRWQAVVAVAERAVHTEVAPRPVRRAPRRTPHGVDVRSAGTVVGSTTGGGTARRRRST